MRLASVFALLFSLVTVSVCLADARQYRKEALSAIQAIGKYPPPPFLAAEYASILDTYTRAENLSGQSRDHEAAKLYELALLKSSLYEKRARELGTPPANGEQPSAASPPDTPRNENTPGKPPAPEPSRTPDKASTQPTSTTPDAMDSGKPETPGSTAPADQAVSPSPLAEEDDDEKDGPITSSMIIGEKRVYTVKRSQSLRSLGAKLGVNWRKIARDNGLDPSKPIKAGQKLRINTLRIVPKTRGEGIVINIPDRTLYLFRDKKLEKAVPVGLGMKKNSKWAKWQTPTGRFRITSKVKDPAWFVPPSIQREMKERGKTVITHVPPGKKNPLGRYALKTTMSGILIHGTTRPSSINTFSSHGCIRVHPARIEEIFSIIRVNTGGEIIYQPIKVALSDDGRVFMEVHADAYSRIKNMEAAAKEQINIHNAEDRVDWDKVRALLRRKSGVPEDVTMAEPEAPVREVKKGTEITTAIQ
ncbi:MAG: L,D-transpeptidase family protein [Geobacteraceae bacterium]|nr:L,D-transpeptidase family protein [Geobacteraceae bacterium]